MLANSVSFRCQASELLAKAVKVQSPASMPKDVSRSASCAIAIGAPVGISAFHSMR
jgi:hypothetical protein